jgi:putative ABC transport system substrate-binding protein
MRGRGLLGILALLFLAMPGAIPAQRQDKTPRIGALVWWNAGTAATERNIGPFREGLRELEYFEGRTLLIEWRFADERSERAAASATELVGLGVDLIVAVPGPTGLAAQRATRTVPIVVISAADPVGMGLVKSPLDRAETSRARHST